MKGKNPLMSQVGTVVFYVSGHGFGHASRQIEIINSLTALRPETPVAVRTSAPRRLFDRALTRTCKFAVLEPDTGVVQVDSLRVNPSATIAQAWDFHRTLKHRARDEARFLTDHDAALVVGDIPPLAFEAAAAAGVPGIGISNFTWDWISQHYGDLVAATPALLPRLRAAYSLGDVALRLPMAGGFEAFRRVVDVPLVARHSRQTRKHTRAVLGLPTDCPLVLVSFGRYGLGAIDWTQVGKLRHIGIVVTDDPVDGGATAARPSAPNVHQLNIPAITQQGIRYEDLVASVDVVLSKPGYGIVAECAANDTALLYTSRGAFAEYQVLVDTMPRLIRCAYIKHDELFAGTWSLAVQNLLDQPAVAPPRTDGAQVVARRLASYL